MRKFFGFGTSKKESDRREEAISSKERSSRFSGKRQTVSSKGDLPEAINGFGEKERQIERERAKSKAKSNVIGTLPEEDKRRQNTWIPAEENPRLGSLPKQHQAEQVAAGWPAWLTAVAGEAIKGWLPRRADSFEKIDKIGQGTYSNVYKARDLESGKVVALKKVRFDNLEPESVRFMAREIKILRRLDHPNVVKLEGLVTSRMSCSLYLVFEFMDHDLSGLASSPGVKFTETQVKCCLLQILKGLDHCHSRGVLHRDIKGSNLLLDSGGNLKIADFGLATFFQPGKRQQLTTRVVTLWYRPPELLLGATEYGTAIDIWSTGCILGELFAGRPIMPGRTEVEQLHKIFKLCGSPPEVYWNKYKLPHATVFKPQNPYKRTLAETYKDFPQTALDLLDILLAIDPDARGSASSALNSEFFTTKPFACEPSSLPKYSPSKELDAGMRDNEARRQNAAGRKAHRPPAGSKRDGIQENSSKVAAVQDANAELAFSHEKRRSSIQASSKSRSERFNLKKELPPAGLPANATRDIEGVRRNRLQPLVPLDPPQPDANWANPNGAGAWDKKQREEDSNAVPSLLTSRTGKYVSMSDFKQQATYENAGLSRLSTLVAARNNSSQEFHKDTSSTEGERVSSGPKISKHEQADSTDVSKQAKKLDRMDVQDTVQQTRIKTTQGFGGPAARNHFSGPLLPPSANLDDMLQAHERQIQKAVRQARHDKGRNHQKVSAWQTQANNGSNDNSQALNGGVNYIGPTAIGSKRFNIAKSLYLGGINEDKEPKNDAGYEMQHF